jgi:predicted Ser/Thr protein kinase
VNTVENLGKYTNLEMVGKGTMGVVYRAHDDSLGDVAIKVMSARLGGNPRARDRFLREARVAASLNHPNIVDIHGMGETDGRPYIVMEFLEGDDLKALISRGGEVPLERRLELMKQVVGALAYAHNGGVAHRDIKPGNIFVTRDGDVRLLDFGIACIKGSTMTATGVVLGTPAYMSPEQVVGKKVDRRSDVFAAGTVFYELLSGERAFPGKRVNEIFDEIMQHQPTPIHRLNDLMPESLSAIIHKAMAKEPEHRYQSMDELLAHLERFDDSIAKLRDRVRRKAEAGLVRLGELRAGSRQLVPAEGVGETQLPKGYLELHAFVRGLAEEHAHTDMLIGELQWVENISAASLEEYSATGLRLMANRVDEIRALCPEESGVKRLGRRLLDALKDRLRTPPHLTTDPEASGEFA